MINMDQLEMGDILLLQDCGAGFYRHAAVISEIDKQNNVYKPKLGS